MDLSTISVRTRLINLSTFALEEFEIGSMPPYVAASHTWAENFFPITSKNDIASTSGMKRILSALKSPLRNLPEMPQYFWVCTWCIDQSNDGDKRQQIPLMGHIYRDAEFVIVTVEQSFTFTQEEWDDAIAGCRELLDLQNESLEDRRSVLQQLNSTEETVQALIRASFMIREITDLPWAKRIWTAQEYVLCKSAIFVGHDSQILQLHSTDICHVLDTRQYIGTLQHSAYELMSALHYSYSDKQLASMMSWRVLSQLKVNAEELDPARVMMVAQCRGSTVPSDAIYGLMAASGVIIPSIANENLETTWSRWWAASLNSGTLVYALTPLPEVDAAEVCSPFWNCAMPPCEKRFQCTRGTYWDKQTPLAEVRVQNGTISVLGRDLGTCHVEKFLFKGQNPLTIKEFSRFCGHDEKLALRVCQVYDVSRHTSAAVQDIAQAICAYWQSDNGNHVISASNQPAMEALISKFECFRFRLHMLGNTYLGRITNECTTTDVLIVAGEELQENEQLMALELCEQRSVRHHLSSVMVVRKPDDPDLPMHKVGMTMHLRYHRADCIIGECEMDAHNLPKELQRFEIGGAACEFCSKRKDQLKEQKHEDSQQSSPRATKRKRH